MEDEVVGRRKWLTHEQFLDLLGAANLIPGPNSTEVAIHVGYMQGGLPGLILAGACFILPAALLVTAAAWAYVRFGSLPAATGVLYGVKPVIIAVIVQAIWRLGRTALKTRLLLGIGLACTVLSFGGVNELIVLFGAGVLMAAVRWWPQRQRQDAGWIGALMGAAAVIAFLIERSSGQPSPAPAFGLESLFLFFARIGSVLFGSGYVLLAFLRNDLVSHWHWLTSAQLLDATAVGQVTPGPVFTTATFIGYLLGGVPGAIVATAGIFLPAFIFVGISGPFIPRIRKSVVAGGFLDGVNAAALALMAVVTWQLGRAAVVDPLTAALALLSAALLIRFRLNSVWLVAGGAAAGLIATWLRAH
jgi:chromate transporter